MFGKERHWHLQQKLMTNQLKLLAWLAQFQLFNHSSCLGLFIRNWQARRQLRKIFNSICIFGSLVFGFLKLNFFFVSAFVIIHLNKTTNTGNLFPEISDIFFLKYIVLKYQIQWEILKTCLITNTWLVFLYPNKYTLHLNKQLINTFFHEILWFILRSYWRNCNKRERENIIKVKKGWCLRLNHCSWFCL